MENELPSFWTWFCRGTGGRPGYRRVLNVWMLLHGLIGIMCAFAISKEPAEISQSALLPLMAIFIGLTFSWAGNAHSLLQSPEILEVTRRRQGGIAEYIFVFQLAVLIILVAAVAWVIPSLGLPFLLGNYVLESDFDFCAEVLLYALLSVSFRTSWHAVLGANMLLLVRARLLEAPSSWLTESQRIDLTSQTQEQSLDSESNKFQDHR